MRVALNATSLLSPLTGIGQYCRQIALGLAARPEVHQDLFLGGSWSNQVPEEGSGGGTTPRYISLARRIPGLYTVRRELQARRFAAGARERRVDVYHEPNILALPFDGPTVVTVHDLSWIRHPQSHPANRVRALNRYFERGLRQASVVVTDCEFIRQEVITQFGFAPDRILSIPLGFEDLFHPRAAEATQATLARHGLVHGQYLLAVGTLEPRKNLQLALRAYRSLPPSVRARHPLVVVGMKGWKTSALEQELLPLVEKGEVRQLGYLPREDLAVITSGALALAYPSLYEGFGLPPLEAMASRVPVVVSNSSSLPEVVGDAALMVEPDDVDALAGHFARLIGDAQLRESLAERALARSANFSWDRCVDETLAAYRLALGSAATTSER